MHPAVRHRVAVRAPNGVPARISSLCPGSARPNSTAFSSASLPSIAGRGWQLDYQANLVSLTVTLAGDYNADGTVTAADYTLWADNFGAVANPHFSDALHLFGASEDMRYATTVARRHTVERHQVNHRFSIGGSAEFGALAIETKSNQSADSKVFPNINQAPQRRFPGLDLIVGRSRISLV